jgi:carnitine 3-dehydrogenase
MRHFVEQFGPTLSAPWSKLVDVPELSREFVEKLAAQSDAQARGQTISQLEQQRDDCLVTLLQGLRAHSIGAGETLAAWERDLAHSVAPRARSNGAATAGPLELFASEVAPEWIDYNGHVTESRYLELFGLATDELLLHIGLDDDYRAATGSYYTVETHICHLRELFAGDRVRVTTQLLGCDAKRLHIFHVLLRDGEEDPIATGEHMLLHVDTATGHAAPARRDVAARVAALVAAHARLPRPDRAGRRIAAV